MPVRAALVRYTLSRISRAGLRRKHPADARRMAPQMTIVRSRSHRSGPAPASTSQRSTAPTSLRLSSFTSTSPACVVWRHAAGLFGELPRRGPPCESLDASMRPPGRLPDPPVTTRCAAPLQMACARSHGEFAPASSARNVFRAPPGNATNCARDIAIHGSSLHASRRPCPRVYPIRCNHAHPPASRNPHESPHPVALPLCACPAAVRAARDRPARGLAFRRGKGAGGTCVSLPEVAARRHACGAHQRLRGEHDRIEALKWDEGGDEATLVIGDMDWSRFSIRHFEGWRLARGSAPQARVTLDVTGDQLSHVADEPAAHDHALAVAQLRLRLHQPEPHAAAPRRSAKALSCSGAPTSSMPIHRRWPSSANSACGIEKRERRHGRSTRRYALGGAGLQGCNRHLVE